MPVSRVFLRPEAVQQVNQQVHQRLAELRKQRLTGVAAAERLFHEVEQTRPLLPTEVSASDMLVLPDIPDPEGERHKLRVDAARLADSWK